MTNLAQQWSSNMVTSPSFNNVTCTPSDTVNIIGGFRSLYVGGGGDVPVVNFDDTVTIFTAVPQGTILPSTGKRVNLTGVSASLIIAMR